MYSPLMNKICLNMIVKNETANLLRCFNSVLPIISCWNIVDTGSSDGTPELIRGYFGSRDIPGYLHHVPFQNFSQSRNGALATARESSLDYDYLLFTDADMELVIDDPLWQRELTGAVHDVLQRMGSVSYWNVRLVHRSAHGVYRGVTHEYFDQTTEGHVTGIWYRDHASGGSRGDKFERDIRLLREDLQANPSTERSWFYLAQSLRDNGQYQEAIDAYKKRLDLGGWEEERWYSKRMISSCYSSLGDDAQAVYWSLEAYNDRPWRAEPLYDEAKRYRLKGKNNAALCFIERGFSIPHPHQDLLFVEDEIYKTGFREELAIVGFYSESDRQDAFLACDDLVLDPKTPEHVREVAKNNLFHYLQPAVALAPSFYAKQIELEFPPPYVAMNPSVVYAPEVGGLLCNVRTVNYRINEAGQYVYPDGDPFIRTRNWLCDVSDDLSLSQPTELIWERAQVPHGEVLGLEDIRLWYDLGNLGGLRGSATVLQLHPGHPRQMVSFRIRSSRVYDLEELSSPHGCEKNWMPILGKPMEFVYSMDSVWGPVDGRRQCEPGRFSANEFRGGGQCVPFDGGYLGIIHVAMNHQHYAQRMYAHRFVWFNETFRLDRVSLPFVFFDRQIEFAAGLVHHGGRVLVSFGVRDREAWIASFDADEIRAMVR